MLPRLRSCSFALACLAALALLLIFGFYAEENWRGARAFAAVQAELQAEGETLDWHRFVPPPVPDDQNLAMCPLFAHALAYQTDPRTHSLTFGLSTSRSDDLKDLPYSGFKPTTIKTTGYDLALRTDLPGYQAYYRQAVGFPHPEQPGSAPDDVLLALTRFAPVLDELTRAVAERPLTRFPIDWSREELWSLALPHYHLETQLGKALCLRASASLAVGHTADALRDLETGLRLWRDAGAEHFTISQLVENAGLRLLLTPVWEGLADRRWSPAELARLQNDLQPLDLLAGFADAERLERAGHVSTIEYLARRRDVKPFLTATGWEPTSKLGAFAVIIGWMMPHGWFDQNRAIICRCYQDDEIKAVDVEKHRYLPARSALGQQALKAMPLTPLTVFAHILLPLAGDAVVVRAVRTQTSLDQAVTAVALERFFQDRQAYPAHLDELVPAYLPRVPNDVLDGAPLRYQPAADGRFKLYSVGLNQRDDGGTPAWTKENRLDDTRGDWVWQYAALAR